MIGVSENNLGIDVCSQFMLMNRLDSTRRANRHKDRGGDITMVCMKHACPGITTRVKRSDVEMHGLFSTMVLLINS